MKILLTGAGGFLGSHFIQFLKNKNLELSNIGNSNIEGVKFFDLNQLKTQESFDEVLGEIQPDVILHLAGVVSRDNEELSKEINVNFCEKLLSAVRANNLFEKSHFIAIGSAAEYGYASIDEMPISEEKSCEPYSLYGKSKLEQTLLIKEFDEKLNYSIFRVFNLLGRDMPTHLAIGNFINQVQKIQKENKEPVLNTGNLNTSRDYLSAKDTVEIIWSCINKPETKREIFNLCSGKASKISEILDFIIKLSDLPIQVIQSQGLTRKIDMDVHYGNNSKILNVIGDFDFCPWEEVIKEAMGTDQK